MEPNKAYIIRWTQPYSFGTSLEELDALMEELIELSVEYGDMAEAKQEIKRIMEL
jgi:hypothetical protein